MPVNPPITPGACAVVSVSFASEVFAGDSSPRTWTIIKRTGGVDGDIVAQGNYPSASQPDDAWSVSGDAAAFQTGPTVCAPLSAGTPPLIPFDGYVLLLKSEVNGFPIPVVQNYRGAFTVPTSSEPPVDPPARPAPPTIAAVGFLNGNVPQINVSGS